MNPSYIRIALPKQDAMSRLKEWLGLSEIYSPRKLPIAEHVDKACDDQGEWVGLAVSIYEVGNWTIFEDLTGELSNFPSQKWLEFTKKEEFVLAGYNDAVPYGQLIVINNGKVIRDFLDDELEPSDNINKGSLDDDLVSGGWTWNNLLVMINFTKNQMMHYFGFLDLKLSQNIEF